jgi:hypothetical protein
MIFLDFIALFNFLFLCPSFHHSFIIKRVCSCGVLNNLYDPVKIKHNSIHHGWLLEKNFLASSKFIFLYVLETKSFEYMA